MMRSKLAPTTPAADLPAQADAPNAAAPNTGVAARPAPLAVDEATMAGMIGVSPEHLGNLTREGLVPAVKLGRRTLYSVRAMDALLFERAMRNLKANDAGGGTTLMANGSENLPV